MDLEIEIHAHDDLGLATANSLAAAAAGATHISTTVNGLGERAGNAPLEEVVMGLQHLYGVETGVKMQNYLAISQLVARASGRAVAVNKSIVGDAVFPHESGTHVDGLIKHARNYQNIDPREVGRENRSARKAFGFPRGDTRLRPTWNCFERRCRTLYPWANSRFRCRSETRTRARRTASLLSRIKSSL